LIKAAQSFRLKYTMVERVVVGAWKTNCYIYSSSKKECIIIDPGGDEAEISSRVDVLNMVPIGIALTHGHVDHLAALGRLRDGYARRGYKLPIAINPADRRFLGTGGMETHRESLEHLGLDEESFFGVESSELPKADVRLKDGDRVFDMDVVVLETPGHTPGSVCFYGEKEGILFSGDTLFFDGVGRTDLPGGSEKKLKESIQKKIAILPSETRVFPGHGPFTTVERERRSNIFFREAPPVARPEAHRPPSAIQLPLPLTARRVVAPAKPARAAASKRAAPSKRAAVPKRRPGKAAAPAKGRARPAKPAPRSKVLKSKGRPVKKSRPAASRPAKKRAQATRSMKAPGSGRKPAR
jgi:glyoxylase-like metal-dependent hydrolase (beta-lactamase superfamily II)